MPGLLLPAIVGEVEEELEKASNEGRTLGNYASITAREADHGHNEKGREQLKRGYESSPF